MPTRRSAASRAVAEARAVRSRCQAGVTLGRGVRLGRGVSITAQRGGTVSIGAGVEVGSLTTIIAQPGARLVIGKDVFISGSCTIAAAQQIEIGDECMIAEMVSVRDHDHHPDFPPRSGRLLIEPVRIGARSWLASKSSVVRGGQVGDDVVVGAHALVNRPIPSGTVAVGVPARVVRQRLTS